MEDVRELEQSLDVLLLGEGLEKSSGDWRCTDGLSQRFHDLDFRDFGFA